jgi:hypothetical protein
MKPSIFRADALVTDPDALSRLLEPLPDPGSVREALSGGEPFFAQAWHPETNRDYWVASDGEHVACFTVAGLTAHQAAEVRELWGVMRENEPDIELNGEALTDIVNVVLKQSPRRDP